MTVTLPMNPGKRKTTERRTQRTSQIIPIQTVTTVMPAVTVALAPACLIVYQEEKEDKCSSLNPISFLKEKLMD